jgi:hypothetical protein
MGRLLLIFSLTGCGGGFLDQTSCQHDIFGWYPGLSMYLDEGSDLGFTIAPEQSYIDKINGAFITNNAETDFYWYTTYSGQYYLNKSTTQGIGTAYTNGDLDILYVTDIEDTLGDEWRTARRETRTGCSGSFTTAETDISGLNWGSIQTEIEQYVSTDYTIASDDRVNFTSTSSGSGYSWSQTGSVFSDLDETWVTEWTEGQTEYFSNANYFSDGTRYSNWEQSDNSVEYKGTDESGVNGSVTSDYTIAELGKNPYARIHMVYQYSGVAAGTWTDLDSGTVCDMDITASGRCTYECDDGSSGNC